MYSDVSAADLQEGLPSARDGAGSGGGRCRLPLPAVQLAWLTGLPFFLHGYFPVLLLLLLDGQSSVGDGASLAVRLLRGLRGGVLWPYLAGAGCALAASAAAVDSFGRRTTMRIAACLLSLLLLLLTLAPSRWVGGGLAGHPGPEAAPVQGEQVFEDFNYSFADASYGAIAILMALGFLINLFVLASLFYIVEVAASNLRGYKTSQAVRQILFGVMVACLVMALYPVWGPGDDPLETGRYSPHWLYLSLGLCFRWHYALPLMLCLAAAVGLGACPDSPYWLMAQRTPADCIASLRKLRETDTVGAEYGAIYEGASEEARQDSGWRSLLAAWPLRYVACLGAALQAVCGAGGMGLLLLQGQLFLRLCGLSDLPPGGALSSAPGCAPAGTPLPELTLPALYASAPSLHANATLYSLGRPDISATATTAATTAAAAAAAAAQYATHTADYASLSDLGLCLALLFCLLGAYAGKACYAMLCYAMLCYAVLCYAMLCYAMLCYAMLCYAMLCYAMLCYAMI
jgi:hypothetical protein